MGIGSRSTKGLQGDSTRRRPTAYSTKPEDACNFGVQIINELNERGGQVFLANNQAAIYLHVDDTSVYTSLGSAHSAEAIMHLVADIMEEFGFLVPERYGSDSLSKAIGYNINQANARFTLPAKKLHQLSTVLFGLAAVTNIDVDVLRSVVGLYNFGAQLRRDLMSIPHAIYRMIDSCSGYVVKQWPSVQRELRSMASLLPLTWVDAGWKVSNTIFASDAMGAEAEGLDVGGYGVVVSELSDSDCRNLLGAGEVLGKSLGSARLHRNLLEHPERPFEPTVPFTRIDKHIFEEHRWTAVDSGRWRYADHIALGEGRAALKSLQFAALLTPLHKSIVVNLEDNMPVSGAFNKGRSSAWQLNYLCRRKAAICVASSISLFLPWIETQLQPADKLSRACPSSHAK